MRKNDMILEILSNKRFWELIYKIKQKNNGEYVKMEEILEKNSQF